MPDEVSGISRIVVDRNQREFPRRDGQQQGNRRQPPRHQPPAPGAGEPPDEEPPVVGSRLNVRA